MKFKLDLYGVNLIINGDGESENYGIFITGDYVNYKTIGYIFGFMDYENFVELLSKALRGEDKKGFTVESIDWDFKITYKPSKTYTRTFPTGYTGTYTADEEFRIEIEFLKDGALTDNILSMSIEREDADAMCKYFKYLLGLLTEKETCEMLEKGYFIEN